MPEEDAEVVRRFAESHELEYPVIVSPQLADQYHVTGLPTTLVIDRQGVIRYLQSGEDSRFISVIDQLLHPS